MPSERYKDEQHWSWMSGDTQTSRTTAVNIVPRGKRRLLLNTGSYLQSTWTQEGGEVPPRVEGGLPAGDGI